MNRRLTLFCTLLVASLLTLTGSAAALDLTSSGQFQQSENNTTAEATPTETATPSSTPTPTPEPTETAEPEPEDDGPTVGIDTGVTVDNTTYAQEIDPNLRLVSWEYSDDAFQLVFEADRSKSVTLTEALQFSAGAGSGRIYSQRLPEGTTEVTVPVEKRAGQAALTMVTSASMARNSYSYVSTGQTQPERPAITYQRAQFLIGAAAIGAAGLTLRVVRRKRDDEEKEVERIL